MENCELDQIASIPLEDIAKKIDYEKACNFGLYNGIRELPEALASKQDHELLQIYEYCND